MIVRRVFFYLQAAQRKMSPVGDRHPALLFAISLDITSAFHYNMRNGFCG